MKANRVFLLVVLFLAAACFVAGADAPMIGQPGSLVEVYGLIDTGLRFSTEADSLGNSYFGFSQGLFNGTRWGIRGTEDLGGVKAIYTFEGGIILPVGIFDQQNQILGRQAWVGVSSDYGTLTFGRQYGTFSDALGVGDVFGGGHGNVGYFNGVNYNGTDAVNFFFGSEMGFRWDQSVKYAANFSGVTVGAMAMLGNLTNNFQYNTMFAGSIGYNAKGVPITAAVGIQYESDTVPFHHLNVGGGLKYALDPTDGVYVFYFHSQFDSGFSMINPNDSEFKATATTKGRIDDIGSVGVNYYVLPSLNLIGAYFLDYAQNVASSGDNGIRNSVLVTADYYFSKDFDAYIGGWVSLWGNALESSANGGDVAASSTNPVSSSISVMLGARFRF